MNSRQRREYEELAAEYKKAVQTANKRLQRLEKYAEQPEYGPTILEYAYRVAQREIHIQRGSDTVRRFSSRVPTTLKALKKELNRVNRFMELPSSTLPGIKNIYVKRADRLNELMAYGKFKGPKFTWQQYAKFFESGLYQKVSSLYGSDIAFKVMGQFIRRGDKIKKYLSETEKLQTTQEAPRLTHPGRPGRYDSRVQEVLDKFPDTARRFYDTLK